MNETELGLVSILLKYLSIIVTVSVLEKTLEQKGLVDVEIKRSCVNMNHFLLQWLGLVFLQ